jgi:hypothetical protein
MLAHAEIETPAAPHFIPIDARHHPYWRTFRDGMRQIRVAESEIITVWTLILKGVKLQRERNATNRRYEPNEHFLEVASRMEQHLRPASFKNMALWSGGYDLSLYARSRGYETLETTRFGRVVDCCKLCSDWKAVSPLWNALSRTYVRWIVAQEFKKDVHVFIRCDDPGSVLQREEIPAIVDIMWVLMDEQRPIRLRWHVVWGDGPPHTLREASENLEKVDSHVFSHGEEAMKILRSIQTLKGNRRS